MATLSSRIFVKGLPPTLKDVDFRKHFSAGGRDVTDVKLIPNRGIGYVGFKSPEDAVQAVKYFNRTFIRMSRINVEIAKPIGDASLLEAKEKRKKGHLHTGRDTQYESKPVAVEEPVEAEPKAKKRKREDVDESDSKVQEFLEVMLPKRNPTKEDVLGGRLANKEVDEDTPMLLDERESDDEYEYGPAARSTKQKPTEGHDDETMRDVQPTRRQPESGQPEPPAVPPDRNDRPREYDHQRPLALDAEEDNWLRSKTNRLLDLVDEEPVTTSDRPADAIPINTQTKVAYGRRDEPSAEEELDRQQDEAHSGEEAIESVRRTKRLFVRNLPYSATDEDLRSFFGGFGTVEEVLLAADNTGKSKGFALVLFADASSAVDAFQAADGRAFQGRLLHVLPGAAKRDQGLDEFAISKLPLKKQNQIRKKAEAATSSFNWNALYMSQDAVNTAWADRLKISKAELLDPTSSDAAVKQAIAETSIILETKAYFASNGVDLDSFKSTQRGDTAILVKNFPYGTTTEELRKMFEEGGPVLRVLMPPSGTIAIVQFAQPSHAKTAFGKLAYRRIKDSVLFLEKAPKNLFTGDPDARAMPVPLDRPVGIQKLTVTDLLERDDDTEEQIETSSVFVRNLNFDTTTEQLAAAFKALDGFISARVKTKVSPKRPGQTLSMGFGFVEFKTKEQAHAAVQALDGTVLDGHSLSVRPSTHHRAAQDAADEKRREHRRRAGQRTKIVIKNLPFEATKQDVRSLFGTYGQLRAVRVPKRFNHSSRGFAFADFVTPKEAENALRALGDTHLLGRRLVLEFAQADAEDPEEEIERMQKKIGGQVNKVALQRLTGKGRARFSVGDDGEDGETGD